MPHWHDHNPWADRVVYVPVEELAACVAGGTLRTVGGDVVPHTAERVLEHWRQGGDRLDAYLLEGPNEIHAGIRYGAEPSEYFSPGLRDIARARELLASARQEAEVSAAPAP